LVRNELATQARRPGSAAFHLILLGCYLVAGVAVSWPRASYLAGRLPATVDQGGYVWSFWWVAHQIAHLGNPWSTRLMAAPVGMQLGFDTLMPLLGAVMAPVTGLFGPSASYNLLAIVIPGLLCYAAYRAARLWLPSQLGAVAAGAFYGLATMLVWEDWYHINIAAGALLLPPALEAAVRLKRRPRARQAVIVGLVIGASVLVNQESAFMVALVAALVVAGWLIRDHTRANAALAGLAVAVTLVVASPQLVAMIVQYSQGGVTVSPQVQAPVGRVLRDAAFGHLRPLAPAGGLRPDRAGVALQLPAPPGGRAHLRRGADGARAARRRRGLAPPRYPAARPRLARGGAARARPRPDHRRAEARPAAPALARRPGLRPDALHLVRPDPGAGRLP